MRKSTTCSHREYRSIERPFSGCVAPRDCDPRSHGGVAFQETCVTCGAERAVNSNGGILESSPWAGESEVAS
jgi:hypothetical protein